MAPTKSNSMAETSEGIMAKGMKHPCQIPEFKTKMEERQWAKEHLAGAFRVFGRKGFAEGNAGHISIRDPIDRTTFWMNPLATHFSMMTVSDLVHCDEFGNILPDGNQKAINAAGFSIHSAIHKARPEVDAACHAHTVYGKAFSAYGKLLDMINQDACIFYDCHSIYDDFGGVALDPNEGKEIAERLAQGKAVILQNHGILTVGQTVDEAAYLFCLMERTCECQLIAQAGLGQGEKLKVIGDREAYYTNVNTGDPNNLYACFQPEFNYELKLDSSFKS